MMRLKEVALPDHTMSTLAKFQKIVNRQVSYKQQVAKAKSLFKAKNKKTNPVFKVIREKLAVMCAGARRCCYCEDSCADEVEHIAPKALYPERCFVWENYLYACGPCNGQKNSRYEIFNNDSDDPLDVTRKRGEPVAPPPDGEPVFINPRLDDPFDYIWMDMNTFRFVPDPMLDKNSKAWKRAKYTINTICRLNERELLVSARKSAFNSYLAHLKVYIADRDKGCALLKLNAHKNNIQSMAHPSVWHEMKRQRAFHQEVRVLFQQAPEALDW